MAPFLLQSFMRLAGEFVVKFHQSLTENDAFTQLTRL